MCSNNDRVCLKNGPLLHLQITQKDWPIVIKFGIKNDQFNLHLTAHTFVVKRDANKKWVAT